MVAQQKRAWFALVVITMAFALFAVSGLTLGWNGAWGAFGLLGLLGFQGFLWRRETCDERDVSIARRAVAIAGMASYATFILGCMGVWLVAFWMHHNEQVSVHILPAITGAGGVVCVLMYSIAILVLYSRHVEAENV